MKEFEPLVDGMIREADHARGKVLEYARDVCRAHEEWVLEQRDTSEAPRDWPVYRPVVREKENTAEIFWLERTGWIKVAGKNKLKEERIARGGTDQYSERKFRRAGHDEIGRVMATEEKFAECRKMLRMVGSVRKTIANARRRKNQ